MALIVLALPLAIVGVAPGRWTRLRRLMVDAVIGLLPATLAALTMASFFAAGPTILAIVGICFVVGGGIRTLGALGGCLGRMNLERTR